MTVFSHSRIACFEQCPLKFKLKYIDKVKTEREQSIEAFMGTLVHAALEKLYRDLRFSKLDTLEELLAWFRDEWKRGWNDRILIVRNEYTQENYRSMGEKYIRDYYSHYHPFDQSRTIALEEKVSVSLDPEGRYRLRGVIDRLACDGGGVYEVHDYKTRFSIPVKEYIEDDRQLALYALAVLHNYQDARRVRLVWHFLSADKEVVLEKSQEELDRLRKDTMKQIDRITSARDFPPKPGMLCSWCEFRSECPSQRHVARTENLPANEYLKEPGVKLVNRYAELKQKQREFNERTDGELARIQEALFSYGKREGVDVVAGSDVKARLWSRDCLRFPGKKDPGRADIEEIIRSSGHWGDASMLDTWELERLVDEGRLPPELIKRLARFTRRERIERVFISRLDSRP